MYCFVESEVDKRSKLFKAVSSTGYAANLTMPGDKQLMLWLGGIVKRENKLIQEQTMQYFLQLVEHDMNGMRQEMEKLICYVGHRQVIEKADVDAVCCVFVENKVFDMISAVAEKNQKRAMQLYDDLVALKEPPMRILYLMIKQFNTLYEVRDLAVKGYPASAIAEKTAIRDFYREAEYFSWETFLRLLHLERPWHMERSWKRRSRLEGLRTAWL